MKKRKINILIILLLVVITAINTGFKRIGSEPRKLYMVYLEGEKLGLIEDKQALLDLIDKNQEKIKKQFNIDKVYPPAGLKINSYLSYSNNIKSAEDIYKKIDKKSSFTIKRYVLTITPEKGEVKKINVLDKGIVEGALKSAVEAFIPKDKLNAYINDTQIEVKETGKTIENIYFKEKITIKEDYIDANELILTNQDDLSKYLLFGTLEKQSSYEVKDGDTVETVAYNNHLSTEELLIANPKLTSTNSLLSAGQILNIGLINPMFTVVEESEVIENIETNFDTKYVEDSSLGVNQSYVKQEGQKGLNRVTEKVQYQNGEIKNLVVSNKQEITKPIDKIIVNSTPTSTLGWGWPTISPYIVNSRFGYRWGRLHAGIDITGCGFGSPIFSATSGVVSQVVSGCADSGYYGSSCGSGYGNHVVVRANNGYYVTYAHIKSNIPVSVGQVVGQGTIVGYMGNSGSSTGTHLHFQINTTGGQIWDRATAVDPCKVAFGC